MSFDSLFHRLMSHFPDPRHYHFGNTLAPSTNEELGSPFQPDNFEISGVVNTQYDESYFSNHHSLMVKQESPWSSDDKTSYLGTPFAKRPSIEPLPETPCSSFENLSQSYIDSVSSLRSANSLSKVSSNSSRMNRKIVKPLVATVYWEEEDSMCYQVKANGIVVSRRENDNFVNGTKLLNVTGMSRGRRDGILKVEKGRKVIRNGSMNLKGVWIPYDRALEIARNEGIKDLLYPLFVDDIRSFYKEKGQGLREGLDDESISSDH